MDIDTGLIQVLHPEFIMAYSELSVAQLKQLMREHRTTVFDSRGTQAFDDAHIPTAQVMTDEALKRLIQQRMRATPVVVYCEHGISSRDYCHMLASMGFSNVMNLTGGWQAWLTSANPATA